MKIGRSKTAQIAWDFVVMEDGETGENWVDQCTIDGGNVVHDDFSAAMENLSIHGLLIAEQIKLMPESAKTGTMYVDAMGTQWPMRPAEKAILDDTKVTGYSLGGDDDDEGVVIILQRKMATGKVLNITTPFTKLASDEPEYQYTSELAEALAVVEREAVAYLEGKKAPNPQLEMFGDGTGIE
ncbi:MAG: hypothetical protein KDB14_35230 [Planctomycetales bacterium]|nr:hypothetical protein [Planctomycetales bacterium]